MDTELRQSSSSSKKLPSEHFSHRSTHHLLLYPTRQLHLLHVRQAAELTAGLHSGIHDSSTRRESTARHESAGCSSAELLCGAAHILGNTAAPHCSPTVVISAGGSMGKAVRRLLSKPSIGFLYKPG